VIIAERSTRNVPNVAGIFLTRTKKIPASVIAAKPLTATVRSARDIFLANRKRKTVFATIAGNSLKL